jgi:hypothetical protein
MRQRAKEMTPSSHFRELAYMIKVSDVCSALQGIYDGNLTSEYICDQWMESEFDPMVLRAELFGGARPE